MVQIQILGDTKSRFSCSKREAFEVLNACPPEVIQRFINQSWRFIDAYRNGLTGWAAAWVVRKQKGHQSVSEKAMKALEEVKAQEK
jgi:hypothetical protein